MKPKIIRNSLFASLAMALPASAEVIYSNLQDISIPANFAGVYLNVETGAWNTNINAPVSGWDVNAFFGGSMLWNSPTFQPVRSGNGEMDAVVKLAEGSTVSSSNTYSTFVQQDGGEDLGGPGYGFSDSHMGAGGSQFSAGQEGYLGFRLNGSNYGWMRMVFTNNTGGALIKEWAYDNSGAAIAVANVKNASNIVTLNSTSGNFTLGSAITDSAGVTNLVKSGSGTTTLTAVNTYTGTTTVNTGTLVIASGASTHADSEVTVDGTASLVVNGTIHGSLLATANTTLIGSGTVVGDAIVQGTHNPGNSPGLPSYGNLTYSGGVSIVNWELIDNETSGRGTNFDGINVSGDLNFAGATTINLIFSGTGSNVNWNDDFWNTSQSWLFYDVAGDTLGIENLTITLSDWSDSETNQFSVVRPDSSFVFSKVGSDLYINYTVIPETSTTLLCGVGALALLRRRR